MNEFPRNGQRVVVDLERAEWLRRLAEAARAASQSLRELDDPVLHRSLIEDLEAFRDGIVAELDAAGPGGHQSQR